MYTIFSNWTIKQQTLYTDTEFTDWYVSERNALINVTKINSFQDLFVQCAKINENVTTHALRIWIGTVSYTHLDVYKRQAY